MSCWKRYVRSSLIMFLLLSTMVIVNAEAKPSVTINRAIGQADPTNMSPINFTVIFNESVTDFATGDVSLSGTARPRTAKVTGSGTIYNVAVSGMTLSGTVIASISAGKAHNAAGVGNTASTSTDKTVIYDIIPPKVTINKKTGQADPTKISTINFTVVFSESVTDFTAEDVILTGTAGATTAIVTGISSTNYNVAVSGMTNDGTVIARILAGKAHDTAGNGNIVSTSTDNNVKYISIPSVTINKAAEQADPTNASPINFTVAFSESVTGFVAGDVTLSGTAGAKTVTITGSGPAYNVAVSGMTSSGTVIASISANKAYDSVNNGNIASTSTDNNVIYDIITPTVTINKVAEQADPTGTVPINFSVVFSEPVSDFTSDDVILGGTAGASIATVTGSGMTYNVEVTGMTGSGTVTASLAAGAAHDGAGNANTASTSSDNIVTYDRTAPTATLSSETSNPPNGLISVIAEFSENVTGFVSGDVTVTNGAVESFVAVDNNTYTCNINPTDGQSVPVTINVSAGVAQDAALNSNTASNILSYTSGTPFECDPACGFIINYIVD